MLRLIALTQGRFTLVDDNDYEELSRYRWRANKIKGVWYVERNAYPKRTNETIFMHRQLMSPEENCHVIHKNNIGFDNRRENLEILQLSTKYQRRPVADDATSKYKGVSWYKRDQKWVAAISINKKTKFLGYFFNEEEAADAYDRAAHELHGESADLNFPNKKIVEDDKQEISTIESLLADRTEEKIEAKIARGATRNSELSKSFAKYCQDHPDLRFWQALRNWSEVSFVLVSEETNHGDIEDIRDTFHFEGKNE